MIKKTVLTSLHSERPNFGLSECKRVKDNFDPKILRYLVCLYGWITWNFTFFQCISVTSRQWNGDNERLCAKDLL